MELIEFLKSVELFNFCPEDYLNVISKIIVINEYNDSDVIFEEGSNSDNLYIVKQGKIKIVKKIVDAEIKVLATLKSGDFFGELSIFDNEPRSASAIAFGSEKIIILSIKKEELINFNYNYPHIMNLILQNIIITLSGRMRKINEQLRDKVFWGFTSKK
ncbi:cyclic nucleotide-binding domain-containing protein [Candidatus Dependentiae bacterium]|nr:cyclic nucleotide-binding domain-containing protein [Candidatus Dependentiae bacterium]